MGLFNLIVIATFSAWNKGKRASTNGMIEPMIAFFAPRAKNLILIDSPHPGSDDLVPKIEEYQSGRLVKKRKPFFVFPPLFILRRFNTIKTQPTFKIRDFITVFQIVWPQKKPVDLFIGLESIYTLAGILLKRLGKIKTVVYYVSDYSPTRYSSKLFNRLYLWLDQFCATRADFVWDVSKAMLPARIKVGLDPKKTAPVIHVPNALFPEQINYLPPSQRLPYSLVFAGTIGPENGLDLAIEALALVKKKFPKTTLHIFGAGLKEEEKLVKNLIKKYRLQSSVKDYGFIANAITLSQKIQPLMIGLAPYKAIPTSVRWYADATKIRLYLAAGLPVITTQVPPLGKEVAEKGAAMIVKDNKEEIAKSIITLFSDLGEYQKYQKAAINFAQENTWENTYSQALKEMKIS